MTVIKSIGAALAGFLTAVLLTAITDTALTGIGFLPVDAEPEAYTFWVLFTAIFYRTVFTLLAVL